MQNSTTYRSGETLMLSVASAVSFLYSWTLPCKPGQLQQCNNSTLTEHVIVNLWLQPSSLPKLLGSSKPACRFLGVHFSCCGDHSVLLTAPQTADRQQLQKADWDAIVGLREVVSQALYLVDV